jgi:hypothetical protein
MPATAQKRPGHAVRPVPNVCHLDVGTRGLHSLRKVDMAVRCCGRVLLYRRTSDLCPAIPSGDEIARLACEEGHVRIRIWRWCHISSSSSHISRFMPTSLPQTSRHECSIALNEDLNLQRN